MLGTVTFGKGIELQTFNVVELQARYIEQKGDAVATVRIRIDRPYQGRTVLTLPADCVNWRTTTEPDREIES